MVLVCKSVCTNEQWLCVKQTLSIWFAMRRTVCVSIVCTLFNWMVRNTEYVINTLNNQKKERNQNYKNRNQTDDNKKVAKKSNNNKKKKRNEKERHRERERKETVSVTTLSTTTLWRQQHTEITSQKYSDNRSERHKLWTETSFNQFIQRVRTKTVTQKKEK